MNLPPENILKPFVFRHFASLFPFSEAYIPLVFEYEKDVKAHLAYICPLCLSNYILITRDSVKASADFTLDHVPPQSAGGEFKSVTCKKCNNDSGVFEAELSKKIKWEAGNRGVSGIKTAVRFAATNMRGHYSGFLVSDNEGRWTIDFEPKVLKKAPLLNQWLFTDSSKGEWEGTLKVQQPDQKKVLKTLLKAAYLVCFTHWGYDFAYSANGELIRHVIQGKTDYIIEEPYFWFDKSNLTDGVSLPHGLCFIENPKTFQSFTVNIPLELNGYNCIVPVLIPINTESGFEKIEEIKKTVESSGTMDISFRQILLDVDRPPINGYTEATKLNYSVYNV